MFRDGSARDRLIAELKRRISRINIRLDQQLLDLLDDREKEIIYDRMVNGKTLQQIGNKFGLTRERIRQIEANALQKMRRAVHRSVNT
jgi:RNA polymerase sigma-32 factor